MEQKSSCVSEVGIADGGSGLCTTPVRSINCIRDVVKQPDPISWEEYFMAIACLISKRSKDPSSQVGAVIINSFNRIVGQGYNGMPQGCGDDEFPWNKMSDNPLENKYLYVCHAEFNAILNKTCHNIQNCKIYSVLFPCNECAKSIIQSGIKEVIYMSDKNFTHVEAQAAIKMFTAAGVKYRQYVPESGGLIINFKECIFEVSKIENGYHTPSKCTSSSPPRVYISPKSRDVTRKREGCMEWEEYFMTLAFLAAKRSKDHVQIGAVIVNKNNRIIAQGYNGLPMGCDDHEFMPESENPLQNRKLYMCHAVLNAILNTSSSVRDCVIYSSTYPCNECAKAIIQTGIKEVVYMSDQTMGKVEGIAAKRMFDAARISCRQFIPKEKTVLIDFTEINQKPLPALEEISKLSIRCEENQL